MCYLSVHDVDCFHLQLTVMLVGLDLVQSSQVIFVGFSLDNVHPIVSIDLLWVILHKTFAPRPRSINIRQSTTFWGLVGYRTHALSPI